MRPNWYTEETPGRCPWLAPVAMKGMMLGPWGSDGWIWDLENGLR